MAQRPKWWHTLQEARRQALVAVDFYNRPGDKLSYADFVVHMHLAWQNLMHAHFEDAGTNIYFRDSGSRKYKRDKLGNKVSWDLATCVRKKFGDSDPVRVNIEFFIGLRNVIEHRFQRSILVATAPQAHALVLNFEAQLVSLFDSSYSLAEELRFPVFVQALTPEGVDEAQKLRRQLPLSSKSYITEFEAALPSQVSEDPRYEYRVQLIPLKGSKSTADMAFNFVNTKALTAEQLDALTKGAKVGTVLVAEKTRSVGLLEELLPAAAVESIRSAIPFDFNMSAFTALRWAHGVGPARGEKGDASDGVFCIFSKPHGNHLYTRAYVARCVGELSTQEGYRAVLGRLPTPKPST